MARARASSGCPGRGRLTALAAAARRAHPQDFHRVVKKAIDNSERAKLVYKKRRNRSVIEQCAEKMQASQSGAKECDSAFAEM